MRNESPDLPSVIEAMLQEISVAASSGDAEKAAGLERDLHTFVLTLTSWGIPTQELAKQALATYDIEFHRGY